jgi:hypothetical protein
VLAAMVQRMRAREFHDAIVSRLGPAQAHVQTRKFYRDRA